MRVGPFRYPTLLHCEVAVDFVFHLGGVEIDTFTINQLVFFKEPNRNWK
jgi:hypothetical protein